MQRGWYDRKRRRVRDLACGDLQIYLEVEVRRVPCRRCGKVKQEQLGSHDMGTLELRSRTSDVACAVRQKGWSRPLWYRLLGRPASK